MVRIIKRHWLCTTIICLLSLSIVTVSGCDSQYKRYSLKEGFVHFSFEYPSRYQLDRTSVYDSPLGNTADIVLSENSAEEYMGPSLISVTIDTVSEIAPDYTSRLEFYINHFTSMPRYRLIERQPITVLDSHGEMVIFFYEFPSGRDTYSMNRMEVFFTTSELNWEFGMSFPEANAEEYKKDFKYMLDTLKILD
jgi:hypothetical protein